MGSQEFNFPHQFSFLRAGRQERVAGERLRRHPAATGFLPAKLLLEDTDAPTGASELFGGHSARRPAADNDEVVSPTICHYPGLTGRPRW